jgi:hypothetical protein
MQRCTSRGDMNERPIERSLVLTLTLPIILHLKIEMYAVLESPQSVSPTRLGYSTLVHVSNRHLQRFRNGFFRERQRI